MIDQINLNEIGIKHKFNEELKRYNKFNLTVLRTQSPSSKYKEIDLQTYAKYVLRNGTNEEKRELMGQFKSQVTVTEKKVSFNQTI